MPIQITNAGRTIVIADRHACYRGDIETSFEIYYNAVEDIGGVVDFSKPQIHKYRDTGLEFSLSAFPEEPAALAQYTEAYAPTKDDLVFDLGAYCGVSTVHFAKLAKTVIALEPDPANRSLLQENVERHKARNVVVLPLAIDSEIGQRDFYADGNLGSGLVGYFDRAQRPITVNTVTLQDMIEYYGPPALIKMDIEGAEIAVLAGAKDVLRKHRLRFVVDTGHIVKGQPSRIEVERIFTECGYKAWSSLANGFSTTWAEVECAQA